MSVPVVLIHSGNSTYLYDTLYQLRQSNPAATVYLIGTEESKVYESLAVHVLIEDLRKESSAFELCYHHFSTNSPEFELICLQRWFVLKEFMQTMHLDQVLYIDSDVLLYSDVSTLAERIGKYGMTICGISGHTNFVRYEVLTDFCQFLMAAYQDDLAINGLKKDFEEFITKSAAGGISDMTFLYRYYKIHPDRVLNIRYFDSLEAFDVTIDTGEGEFVMQNQLKKVIWKSNQPFCIQSNDSKLVLHHTLHFQGKAKQQIGNFVRNKGVIYKLLRNYFSAVIILQKLKKKFVRGR